MAAYPLLGATPSTVCRKVGHGGWEAMDQVVSAHLTRAIWSKRQVYEVMVDFWANHFNVTTPSSEVWDSKPLDDRSVVRAHALGTFASMLQASARSSTDWHHVGPLRVMGWSHPHASSRASGRRPGGRWRTPSPRSGPCGCPRPA